MKNIFKAAGYTLATIIAFVFFCFSAFGTGSSEGGALSLGQIISGGVLLTLAILLPAIKSAHKTGTGK